MNNYISYILDCNNGDIQLVGGPTETEGTVEICRIYLWGLVSDLNWGDSEARVVCRQLDFKHKVSCSFLTYFYYSELLINNYNTP